MSESTLLKQRSARRSVLESPALLRTIFDFCDMRTLVKISSVNRFFEAASAPRIHSLVNLSVVGDSRVGVVKPFRDIHAPSPRQIKNMAHARALMIPTDSNYMPLDLSSCSFPRVDIVYCLNPYPGKVGLEQPDLAASFAQCIDKCPDLRNSVVYDWLGVTVGVDKSMLRNASWRQSKEAAINIERPIGAFRSRITRLITQCRTIQIVTHRARLRRTASPNGPGDERLFHHFYPNLLEMVLSNHSRDLDEDLLEDLFILVKDGYKVILAGFQEQNHNREGLKKYMEKMRPAPHFVKATSDQLVDNLVDMVHKISFRELYALPYIRHINPLLGVGSWDREEEDFYRSPRATKRPNPGRLRRELSTSQ